MNSEKGVCHPAITPSQKSDDVPPGYWTRRQAAERLGVTVSEIRRREASGKLKGQYHGPRRVMIFTQEDVDSQKPRPRVLSQKEAAPKPAPPVVSPSGLKMAPYKAQDAAAVFAALREGKSLLECVIEFQIHPDSANAIAMAYAQMQGDLFIPGAVLALINKLPLNGPMPITTPDELLAVLRTAENACVECSKRAAVLCKHCVTAAIRKMAERKSGDD